MSDFKKDIVSRMIYSIGEDPGRSGIVETPARVVKSWNKIFGGYNQNPADLFKVFDGENYNNLVLLKDIEFYSTCEHHLIPFFGKAHIAYIPSGNKIVGISKLARLLEIYSRRMQIQERIGMQVIDALNEYLKPKGAACILEARHLCMVARGVEKQNSVMVTSALSGAFKDDINARQELMRLIK